MKRAFLLSLVVAAGAVAAWRFWPAEPVLVKETDRELKPGDPFPHEMWTKILKERCRDGLVDYAGLKKDRGAFDAYLGFLAKYSPQTHPDLFPRREDRLAYALNAYNAYVVLGVLEHLPVASVRDIGGFFKKFEYPFGGKGFSLEAWETWIRTEFRDPRIHFALNCASLGCPTLPSEAFNPDRLEEQLAREAKAFVKAERNVKVEGGKVRLSSIFKWYRGDFEKAEAKGLAAYIRSVGGDVPEGAEIEFADYDWALNAAK